MCKFIQSDIKSCILLQIAAVVITNWGTVYYKLGKVLQIRSMFIANGAGVTTWDKVYYKLEQVLHISAIYYKLGHNNE